MNAGLKSALLCACLFDIVAVPVALTCMLRANQTHLQHLQAIFKMNPPSLQAIFKINSKTTSNNKIQKQHVEHQTPRANEQPSERTNKQTNKQTNNTNMNNHDKKHPASTKTRQDEACDIDAIHWEPIIDIRDTNLNGFMDRIYIYIYIYWGPSGVKGFP